MLRAGKSPKEIAYQLNVSWSAVKMMTQRHVEVKRTFIETHPLRYPAHSSISEKIPFREAQL